MPASRLQQELIDLQHQLKTNPPHTEEDRESLEMLIRDIELQMAHEESTKPDSNLVDGVNLAVERFEVSHPTVANTLRSIMQSLVSMGI
ncbi:uncharacterized protein DUF4404 [Pseudomonas duriflava]|uniref:Uncharacterized protein DUF4404 n=1 Tax=Pseudomonas duriflava TaxID=459528 RepID=A0A562Q8V7_9PSED|nr:DUF4404 family protein [Pseudomonas duriflava]TWI53148.1 uncharacterized protein DUF4404 [Pseudomonas duriflava]